ncbi:MAG: ATP-binding protein [Clostridia bacterium]|nr:ATP-binding protein [Clostridia bacterium]
MNASRKTTSIANKLNRFYQGKELSHLIEFVIFMPLAAIAGWACAAETVSGADCAAFAHRGLSFSQTGQGFIAWLRSAFYFVEDKTGMQHTFAAGDFLFGLLWVMAGILALGLLVWALGWVERRNQLRQYLKPIDDIALSAEKLSTQSFDPSKFRRLEDAIANIDEPDTEVHVYDHELAGLEAAVNNMLKRLQESARRQSRFVDDASHELRTPIAVIQGYINMLDRWGKDDPQVLRESITAIQTEAEHMKILVEQLLFLARGDMGRQQFTTAPLPLDAMVEEICDESRMIDPGHTYDLQLTQNAVVQADVAMLKQAVRILIDNAAKYTEPGGQITLRLTRNEKEEARIDVQDTGIGISKSDVAHMFERFYRADPARAKQGCGLGLSIARWIIEQHGGHIEVVSYEELGTRVSICLPIETATAATAATAS